MPLRLTLRTLLSYLDDTLEPAEAKVIGGKAAESEQARELMERIKQVTRRRRLTSPPSSGPGGMDPNTIAEYLDNEVTPEKAAEVEQICLASDVHLAEVAGCHQILTLVLGEPALVPPSAKQRMYSLVKGPEAIHSRKPGRPASKPELDLSSEIEPEQDDTLRLGVPSIARSGDSRNLWILLGGGVLAACLLGVALWQLLRTTTPNVAEPHLDPGGLAEVKVTPKPAPKQVTTVQPAEQKKTPEPVEVIPVPKIRVDVAQNKKQPAVGEIMEVEPAPMKPVVAEIPFRQASLMQLPIAQLVPADKEPSGLFQFKADKSGWLRVAGNRATVYSARPLLSLSGSKSVVALLDKGVELTLWGNLPEVDLDPNGLESRIILHQHDKLDADLTLERGRLVIKNTQAGKDQRVRVRFDSPTSGEQNYFDFVLPGKDTTVVVERTSVLDPDEPFYPDKADKKRNGPIATMRCYAWKNSAHIRFRETSFLIEPKREPMVQWQSRKDVLEAPQKPYLPYWHQGMPALTDKLDILKRDAARKGHTMLLDLLEQGKPIQVALAEMVENLDTTTKRELQQKDKRFSMETFFAWRHVYRCYMAIDEIEYLYGRLTDVNTPMFVRGLAVLTLNDWLGLQRDHDYVLMDTLQKTPYRYNKNAAARIVELLHYLSPDDRRKAAKYQQLIDGLTSDLLEIRVLSHWHLVQLVPAGVAIPYDPSAPPRQREPAVQAWRQLIPPGQLPPPPKMPKGK